jgi:hypothetical protein
MKILTGEIEEDQEKDRTSPGRRKGGKKGGKARAARLTEKQRSEIARKAARARWKPQTDE